MLNKQDEIGELIGVFAGDGNYTFDKKYYHHTVRIFLGKYEEPYAKHLIFLFKKMLGKRPLVYKEHGIVLRIRSRRAIDFIRGFLDWTPYQKRYTVSLIGGIEGFSNEFLIGFIRGLIDSDGHVYPHRKILFGSSSYKLASQFSEILQKLGILHKVSQDKPRGRRQPYFRVTITKDNATQLLRIINPSNPKRLREWCLPKDFREI